MTSWNPFDPCDSEFTYCPQCERECICVDCVDEEGRCYECGYSGDDDDEET